MKSKIRRLLFRNASGIVNTMARNIHHTDADTLARFYSAYSPFFFLNTGRSGSAFITSALKTLKEFTAYHEASPSLMLWPNYALYHQNEHGILEGIFRAAREELMLDAFIKGKHFAETNHCLVFFVNHIKKIFPRARFIHIQRHPGDFARSAIMKGWHKNDSIWENNRIRLDKEDVWKSMSQIEKLSWTWASTHEFIEAFKKNFERDVFTVKFEEVTTSMEKFAEMINFIDPQLRYDINLIKDLQKNKVNEIVVGPDEPPNMFKLRSYPKFDEWDSHQKDQLSRYCGDLANKYGYRL